MFIKKKENERELRKCLDPTDNDMNLGSLAKG